MLFTVSRVVDWEAVVLSSRVGVVAEDVIVLGRLGSGGAPSSMEPPTSDSGSRMGGAVPLSGSVDGSSSSWTRARISGDDVIGALEGPTSLSTVVRAPPAWSHDRSPLELLIASPTGDSRPSAVGLSPATSPAVALQGGLCSPPAAVLSSSRSSFGLPSLVMSTAVDLDPDFRMSPRCFASASR